MLLPEKIGMPACVCRWSSFVSQSTRSLSGRIYANRTAALEACLIHHRVFLHSRRLYFCSVFFWRLGQSVVSAVEERAHIKGREELHRGLTTASSEAALLRTELAEVRRRPG